MTPLSEAPAKPKDSARRSAVHAGAASHVGNTFNVLFAVREDANLAAKTNLKPVDSLGGLMFYDDAQVVGLGAAKHYAYGRPVGVDIEVRPAGAQAAESVQQPALKLV